MELSFSIARHDSVETALQLMQNIIEAEQRILKDPAPQIILQAIEDNSARIAIRAWASVQDYWNVYWELSKSVKDRIEAAGLHPPCLKVHLVQ